MIYFLKSYVGWTIFLLFFSYSSFSQYTIDTSSSLNQEHLIDFEIYTASKKTEHIGEVPASVVVVTRSDIEAHGYLSLVEIIENVPGFYNLGNGFFYGNYNFGVRGFASPGAFNDIMVLVNGVNQMEDFNNSFSLDRVNVPIECIDRIEIVRGPMSVVYGSNAFMGIINIITNTSWDQNKVSVGVGNLGTQQVTTKISGKSDNVSFVVNAGLDKSNGIQGKYADLTHSPNMILPLYNVGVDEEIELGWTSHYLSASMKYKDFTIQFSQNHKDLTSFANFFPSNKNVFFLEYEFSTARIEYEKQLTDYYTLNTKYSYYNNNFISGGKNISTAPQTPNTYGLFNVFSSAHEFEMNNFYDVHKKIDLTAGLYFRVVPKLTRLSDVPNAGQANRYNRLKYGESIQTYASFYQVNYSPIQKLKFTGGVRIEESNNYEAEFIVGENGTTTTISPGKANLSGLQLMPRFAAIFSFNESDKIKLLYGLSKKRPSYVDFYDITQLSLNEINIATMQTTELNFHTVISLKTVFDISIFYNRLNNLLARQLINVDSTNIAEINYEGKAATLGTEITCILYPTKKLNIELNFIAQKSQNLTEELKEVDMAFSPNFLGYFKTSYKINKIFMVGVKGRYVGTILSAYDPVTQDRIGENAAHFFVLDLNIRANEFYKKLYSQITISNVMNQEIRYAVNYSNSSANRGMLGFGRRVMLTVGYHF